MLCACVQGGHKKSRCRELTMLESIADSAAMMKERTNPFPLKSKSCYVKGGVTT